MQHGFIYVFFFWIMLKIKTFARVSILGRRYHKINKQKAVSVTNPVHYVRNASV